MSRHHAPASCFSVVNSQFMTDNSNLGFPYHKSITELFNDTLIKNIKGIVVSQSFLLLFY